MNKNSDLRPQIPLLSVASAILGVVGIAAGVGFAKAGELKNAVGVSGAALLLLGFSVYDVLAALRSRIEFEGDGIIVAGHKIPFVDIIGLVPPLKGRGVGIVLNDAPIIWSALAPPEVFGRLRQALENHWRRVWVQWFETHEVVIYRTSHQYGTSQWRQGIMLLMAAPFLWLLEPWMGVVALFAAVLIFSMLAKQMFVIPQQVVATPRELIFQYRNRVSSYAWADMTEAIIPEEDNTIYIHYADGRVLVVPPERPFYFGLRGFLLSNFAEIVKRNGENQTIADIS